MIKLSGLYVVIISFLLCTFHENSSIFYSIVVFVQTCSRARLHSWIQAFSLGEEGGDITWNRPQLSRRPDLLHAGSASEPCLHHSTAAFSCAGLQINPPPPDRPCFKLQALVAAAAAAATIAAAAAAAAAEQRFSERM